MTSLLEIAISVIAPHSCISCGKESNVLCVGCASQVFGDAVGVCFLCNKPTADSRVCRACAPHTAVRHVWMAATYDGAVKKLVKAYKFSRLRAASVPLAAAMADVLPYFADDVVVVPAPTAYSRVRQRGYDHAELLAREIAKQRGWPVQTSLRRKHAFRQVGAGRAARFAQAAGAFECVGDVTGRQVLLVDDVTTSGATLSAAATVLMAAGASRVDAVVAAKHTLE